mgnify:CR=1 FL=1
MSRPLLICLALSAGVHAGGFLALPAGRMGLQGLGWGPPPPRSPAPRLYLVALPDLRVPASASAPAPAPPDLPGDLAGPSAPEPENWEGEPPETFLPPIDLGMDPGVPADRSPRISPPPPKAIPLPPPPLPRTTAPPIRVEDIRWNRRVGDRIEAQLTRTSALARSGLHGSVRLMLFLAPDGRIPDLRVIDPGPYGLLTLGAQAQVRAAAPFPPPPAGMDPRLRRIPVNLHY